MWAPTKLVFTFSTSMVQQTWPRPGFSVSTAVPRPGGAGSEHSGTSASVVSVTVRGRPPRDPGSGTTSAVVPSPDPASGWTGLELEQPATRQAAKRTMDLAGMEAHCETARDG